MQMPPAEPDLHKPRYEGVLTAYLNGARLKKTSAKKSEARVVFPPVFSLIDAPEETLDALHTFASQAATRPARVFFDQHKCESIDLCAGAVLNALARAAIAYARTHPGVRARGRRTKLQYRGNLPQSLACAEIVAATGIPRELGVEPPESYASALLTFKYHQLVQGRFTGHESRRSSVCEIQTTRLVQYLDECFRSYGFKLSSSAVDEIAQLVGEVVNNCEDHSGRPEWWISAYLRQSDEHTYGDCHVTIFNFGRTIAESMQTLPADAKLRLDIQAIVAHHRAKGTLNAKYTEEAVWTLCALQQRVSRKNAARSDVGNQGQGTVRLMEIFQRIGRVESAAAEPAMALISGRTYVSFSRYRLRPMPEIGGESRRIIAFNRPNSMLLPPDTEAVRVLKHRFPGTILSLRFFLDRKYLTKVKDVEPC